MGGASKFIMLLTTPFPFLLHRPRHLSCLLLPRHYRLPSSPYLASLSTSDHLFTLSPTSRPQSRFPVKSIHTRTSINQEDRDFSGLSPNSLVSHPWPEWSGLIDFLSSRGYFCGKRREILIDDEFVAYEDFSDEFVRASSACLAFARYQSDVWGLLSRKDIVVVVENGTPFLFKSAIDTARRMRAFLGNVAGDELDSNKAHTVDLMKYLLSYVSNTTVSLERSNPHKGELIEPAIRNLLSEFARLGCGVPALESSASVKHRIPNMYGQTPRPLRQNMEMKRSDWICPRCDFVNYGKNLVCSRCDCKGPGDTLRGITSSVLGNGDRLYANKTQNSFDSPSNKQDGRSIGIESTDLSGSSSKQSGWAGKSLEGSAVQEFDPLDMSEEAKAQRWFRRVAHIKDISELSEIPDEDFPSIMPMRKGVNRFVVSKRKTPLERRLTSPQYRRNLPVVSSDPRKKGNENS